MKRILFYLSLPLIMTLISSCESMLDTDSDLLAYPDENQLNSPNDSIYAMNNILFHMQKLAEKYVLLGELRADLMDISPEASNDLQEINNHNISKDNMYNQVRDYYSVINSCNYVIRNLDTTMIIKSEKVMLKTYAQAKAMRAWTYLQLALNYGKVKYYENPILNVGDTADFVDLSLAQLIPVLIADLEPWQDVKMPGGFSLGVDLNSSAKTYFPIKFLLGDLYLWNKQYAEAAIVYHDLILQGPFIIYEEYISTWTIENGVFVKRELENTTWPSRMFNMNEYEQITLIAGSVENGKGTTLDSLTWMNNQLLPSQPALNNWNNQSYYYRATNYVPGDLRGDLGSYISPSKGSFFKDLDMEVSSTSNVITKFHMMTKESAKAVSIYRVGLLYLRYAEALNRMDKPNIAFAVLKNGLNPTTLAVDSITPPREKYRDANMMILHDYLTFENQIFESGIGVHARGCGNVYLSTDYKIEPQASLPDSIKWVEDKIMEECALETAFEGNRFHDLMRIALRRNDPSYLANKVAEKYSNNKEAIKAKLMDENNWFLP